MQPKYVVEFLKEKLLLIKYFGGGLTMEYLEDLNIPEFIELRDTTNIIIQK